MKSKKRRIKDIMTFVIFFIITIASLVFISVVSEMISSGRKNRYKVDGLIDSQYNSIEGVYDEDGAFSLVYCYTVKTEDGHFYEFYSDDRIRNKEVQCIFDNNGTVEKEDDKLIDYVIKK